MAEGLDSIRVDAPQNDGNSGSGFRHGLQRFEPGAAPGGFNARDAINADGIALDLFRDIEFTALQFVFIGDEISPSIKENLARLMDEIGVSVEYSSTNELPTFIPVDQYDANAFFNKLEKLINSNILKIVRVDERRLDATMDDVQMSLERARKTLAEFFRDLFKITITMTQQLNNGGNNSTQKLGELWNTLTDTLRANDGLHELQQLLEIAIQTLSESNEGGDIALVSQAEKMPENLESIIQILKDYKRTHSAIEPEEADNIDELIAMIIGQESNKSESKSKSKSKSESEGEGGYDDGAIGDETVDER